MPTVRDLCEEFADKLNRACRARVEVTCRGPDRWTLSGPPADVLKAGKWVTKVRLLVPDGPPVEQDGERYEYYRSNPGD